MNLIGVAGGMSNENVSGKKLVALRQSLTSSCFVNIPIFWNQLTD